MLNVEIKVKAECDACKKKKDGDPILLHYFNGIQYPAMVEPDGWASLSFWSSGYMRCLCPTCYLEFKSKIGDFGIL